MKNKLAAYIKDLAICRGEFTLASGQQADYYVDMRRVSLDYQVSPLIGQVMLEVIRDIPDIYAVGGLTMGADPVAAAIMHQGVIHNRFYHAFVVRKQSKEHGRGKRIEGPDIRGKRVVVVEDTSTTGGSPLKAAQAVREAGGIVAAVAVVVDRETGAKEVIERAGYPYYAALSISQIL